MRKPFTLNDKRRVDEYAEILFDEVFEDSENAAIWFHADAEGEAAIFITRGDPERRRLLIDSLVEALLMDQEMMEDFTTAVALAVYRMNQARGFQDDDEDRPGLSWDDIFDP